MTDRSSCHLTTNTGALNLLGVLHIPALQREQLRQVVDGCTALQADKSSKD
jgi:hypothetical protein